MWQDVPPRASQRGSFYSFPQCGIT